MQNKIIITQYKDVVRACPKPERTPKKEKKPIAKISKKKKEEIVLNKQYYKWAIGQNIIKNKGTCRCDNCGEEIKEPNGKNVSHLVSGGNNQALYRDPLNHFIFGSQLKFDKCKCEQTFSDEGKRSTMKIFPEFNRRWEMLNRKYYTGK